jgi:hypothetical protein
MEYIKLTESEALNISPGTVVNFGNGYLCEVIQVGPIEIKSHWEAGAKKEQQDRIIKFKELTTGKISEGYTFELTRGTTESLDTTIVKCDQCGALWPASELITAFIWKRNPVRQDPGRFCPDKPCAEHRQMGAEG